jgi:hypothetical protein
VRGFQVKNVDAIRSSRIVAVINTSQLRVKAFQIIFSEDGSFFLTFLIFGTASGFFVHQPYQLVGSDKLI